MRRFYHRVGPWMLLFALAWYVAGVYLIKYLDYKRWDLIRSRHINMQTLEIGSIREVRIRSRIQGRDEVKFLFDSKVAKLQIENHHPEALVGSRVLADVVELTLEPTVANYSGYNLITIRAPLSINRIIVEDVWQAVQIGADGSVFLTDLTLVTRNLQGQLSVAGIQVEKLRLEQDKALEAGTRAPSIEITAGTVIDELNVAMVRGTFEFTAAAPPRQSWFQVGDSVQISGQKPFLESIRFIPGE